MDTNNLKAIISNLNPMEKSKVLEKIFKTKGPIPTVEQFWSDPYYLGGNINLYPYWQEKMKLVYPAPLVTKPTTIVKGPIGGGKTYAGGMFMALYDLARLLLVEDPADAFGIDMKKGVAFKFFNVRKEKVQKTVVDPINKLIYDSDIPFFNDYLWDFKYDIIIDACKNLDDIISEDVFFAHLSELNFIDYYKAQEIIDQTFSRVYSRFQRGLGFFNHVVVDSSDTTEDSVVENFIKTSPHARPEICTIISDPIWIIKKHLGIYFNEGSFQVYTGGSGVDPFIMSANTDLSKLDPDRVLEAPNELLPLAEGNIELFLKDQCGIGIASDSLYFKDKSKVMESFTLDSYTDEMYALDFYDDKESIMSYVREAIIKSIPPEKQVVVRLDLGVSYDLAGIAIGYQDEWRTKIGRQTVDGEVVETEVEYGTYKVPIIFGLGRLPEQETCISMIEDFFIELNQLRKILLLSTDQYQSTQLRQDMLKVGIESHLLSVDRTDYSYSIMKRLIYEGRVKFCRNKIFMEEVPALIWTGSKVDHTATGSKDLCDAVAGVLSDLYELGADASTPATREQVSEYQDLISSHMRRGSKNKGPRLW